MPLAEVVSDNHQTKNVNSTIAIEGSFSTN